MPLYKVERDLDSFDENDLEGAALRALACAYWFQGMRWLRSYLDEEIGLSICIYQANSADDVREHAVAANIPCGEVREVIEIGPEMFEGRGTEGAAGPTAALTAEPSAPGDR